MSRTDDQHPLNARCFGIRDLGLDGRGAEVGLQAHHVRAQPVHDGLGVVNERRVVVEPDDAHLAGRELQREVAGVMLDHGLPVNLADHRGNTLLMLASHNGNMETTRVLLEHRAEVNRRNDRGQTALGGVAFKGYEEIVALVLEHGADIGADNGGGMTTLMFAAMFGRTQVVEQLKSHGASLQRRNRLGFSARFMVGLAEFIARRKGWLAARLSRHSC